MFQDVEQRDLFLEAPIWWAGLTGRRRLFVECYCTDRSCFLNATAAFAKAYAGTGKELAESSIQSNASRLMRDGKIKKAVAKLLRARQNEEDFLSEFKTLELLKLLAFYNPGDIIDKYGNLKKDINELGELALCIAGIKKNRGGGTEIKFYDRTKALALLCEYLKLVRPAEGAMIISPSIYLTDKDKKELEAEASAASAAFAAEEAEYSVAGAEA